MPIIANTTSANTFSAIRAQLNSVTKRINAFAGNESTLYANTINANVSLRISGTDVRATFAQNTYVKSVLANTNSFIKSQLANTNASIATQASRITLVNTNLTGTNTALRTLINDRLQVANASTLYATKFNPTTSGLLAHTGRATISTNLAVSGNTSVTGQVFLGTGSAASPSLSVTGDTNTGIFFPAADTIAFVEGGTEAMRINSSGEVTINGTTTGWSNAGRGLLTINGTSSAILGFSVNGGSNGYVYNDGTSLYLNANPGPMIFQIAGTERVRIDTAGNVGIGISSGLNARMSVGKTALSAFTGTTTGTMMLYDSSSTTNYFTTLDFSTSGQANPVARIGMQYTGGGSLLCFGTSNSYVAGVNNTAMTIDPTGILSLYGGGGGAQIRMYNGGDLVMYPADNGSTATMYCDNAGEIRVSTILTADGSTRAPIHYDSNNTNYYCDPNSTSYLYQLRLVDHLFIRNSSPTIYFTDTDHNSAMLHNNSNLFYILRGNTDSTSWNTVVSGNWPMVLNLTNNDVTWGGNISAIYNVVAYASDARLKENVQVIPNAIDKIKQIRGVSFDWKDKVEDLGFAPETKYNDLGVIAQEIQAVLPQAVKPAPFDQWIPDPSAEYEQEYLDQKMGTSKSGENYLTVQLEKIVPLLIEGIKEQQKQIEELREQIELLKGVK
jgi:hypothetical protein